MTLDTHPTMDMDVERRLGGPGPFVINLHASTAPIGVPAKSPAGCEEARLYRIQRVDDGRIRYRLRLGPFATEDEADAVLARVRLEYPCALLVTAAADDLHAIALVRGKANFGGSSADTRAADVVPQTAAPVAPAAAAAVPVAAPVPAAASAAPVAAPAPRAALQAGMTREEVLAALGAPQREASYGPRVWLTYAGMVVVLENGSLASVDRSSQPPSKVTVRSEPDGADVYLGANFVGSTPATLELPTGIYKVSLRLNGYKDWQREVQVPGGSELTLRAHLEK